MFMKTKYINISKIIYMTLELLEDKTLKTYIGFKENKNPEIFEAETKPTKESYPQYDFIYGPFKSTTEAQQYINATGGLACSDG